MGSAPARRIGAGRGAGGQLGGDAAVARGASEGQHGAGQPDRAVSGASRGGGGWGIVCPHPHRRLMAG
jgi:hypothetical protein